MLKQLIKLTSIQTLGRGWTILLSLVTTALLTRKLGVAGYGLFALTTSLFLLIDSIADFGTKIIGVREIAGVNSDKEKNKILVNIVVLRKLLTLTAFIMGLGLVLFYEPFEGIRWGVLLVLLMSWFTSIAGDEEVIFQSGMRLDLKTVVDILYPTGFVILALILGDRLNLYWAFGGYLISRIVSLAAGLVLIRKDLKEFGKLFDLSTWKESIDSKLIKKLLGECVAMGIYLLVFTSYDRAVDSTIIRHFWGEADVARYGLAYKIYSNLVMPAYFLVSSVFPLMSKGKESGITKKALIIGAVMLLGLIPATWILAPWMINVLGGIDFIGSVTILRILSLALIFAFFSHIIGFKIISQGKQKTILWVGLAALTVNVGLNLWLIPYFGTIAAARITVVTEALSLILMLILDRK